MKIKVSQAAFLLAGAGGRGAGAGHATAWTVRLASVLTELCHRRPALLIYPRRFAATFLSAQRL